MVLCISMFLLSGILVNDNDIQNSPKVIPYRKGFIERSETFMIFLLIDIFFTLRLILLWIFSFFVLFTAFLRLIEVYRTFKS